MDRKDAFRDKHPKLMYFPKHCLSQSCSNICGIKPKASGRRKSVVRGIGGGKPGADEDMVGLLACLLCHIKSCRHVSVVKGYMQSNVDLLLLNLTDKWGP
jgi:hypothetical protein